MGSFLVVMAVLLVLAAEMGVLRGFSSSRRSRRSRLRSGWNGGPDGGIHAAGGGAYDGNGPCGDGGGSSSGGFGGGGWDGGGGFGGGGFGGGGGDGGGC